MIDTEITIFGEISTECEITAEVSVGVERIYPTLQEKIVNVLPNTTIEITPDEGIDGLSKVIAKNEIATEQITITPSVEAQTITGKLIDEVVIEAVDSNIDNNIIPTNIRAGVSILGINGNLEPDKPDQEKTITPNKEIQNIVADTGYELSKVVVNPIPDSYVEPNGTLDITENGSYDVKNCEGVNVNVSSESVSLTDASYLFYKNARLNTVNEILSLVSKDCTNYEGLFHSCTNLTSNPKVDFSNALSLSHLFYGCTNLTSVSEMNTSKCTTFDYMFYNCSKLINVPNIDTSSATSMSSMFYNCSQLVNFPTLDTSNVTMFLYMFYGCSKLTSVPSWFNPKNGDNFYQAFYNTPITDVPLLDMGNATNIQQMFRNCPNIVNVGGLKDIGKNYYQYGKNYTNYGQYIVDFLNSTLLTHDSLMNVINNLYDIASLNYRTQKLRISAASLALLSEEEIAIATNKGWVVATS